MWIETEKKLLNPDHIKKIIYRDDMVGLSTNYAIEMKDIDNENHIKIFHTKQDLDRRYKEIRQVLTLGRVVG